MRWTRAVAVFLFPLILATSAAAAEFPAGTLQFFDTRAAAAIPASGGGIWVGTPLGLVRYTESGPGAILPTPGGGAPRDLVMATDGSIWFAADTLIARISPNGTILEKHLMSAVGALAIASDGTLWYSRGSLGDVVGRFVGNVATEFPSPAQSWSLAPASNGQMWVLGNGFGTDSDNLYKMSPAGAVTVLPLGHDVLFGHLQALPDGTLYIGTGIRRSVLRLLPGRQTAEVVSLPGSEYLSDSAGDLWVAGYEVLGYIARFGVPNVSASMPGDPRQCANIPAYLYRPLAIDSTGGLWVLIFDDAFYFPEPIPCEAPQPPPMPDLIRIDTAKFFAANAPATAIPTLSTAILTALAITLVLAAIRHVQQ
jgi:hypothetical protein